METLNDQGKIKVKLPTSKRNIIFVLVTLSYFLVWFDENTFSATTPFWSETYSLGTEQIATISAAYLTGYFPLLFIAGVLSDKIGARLTLLISVLMCGILSLMMIYTHTELAMYLRNLAFGVFFGFNFAPCNKLLSIWTNSKERTVKTSIWNAFGSASSLVASPFGLLVAAWAKWQYAFIIIFVISVVAFIFMCIFLKNKPEDFKSMSQEERDFVNEKTPEEIAAEELAKKKLTFGEMLAPLKSGRVWAMALVISLCIGPTYMGLWGSMYMIRGHEFSAEKAAAWSPVFACMTFVFLFCLPLIMRATRGHIQKVIATAVIIGGCCYLAAAFLPLPPIMACFFALGFPYIVNPWGWGPFNSYWAATQKAENLGTVNGLGAAGCTLVGLILMNSSGKLITDAPGPGAYSMVWCVAGIIMLSTLIPLLFTKKVVIESYMKKNLEMTAS